MAKAKAPAAKAKRGDTEVLPAAPETSQELEAVKADGSTITSFLVNAAQFFSRATDLETRALTFEKEAGKLQPATTPEQDGQLQTFIKTASAAKKTVEEHWGICQAVSQLHRRLTARRSIAVQALERAGAAAQTLHNRYVEEEKRRAAAEQERIRREAEERARQDRERELAALERAAIEAEEAAENLSAREEMFVDRYFSNGDGIAAARYAGFKDPAVQAARLLSLPKILGAVEAKRAAKSAREQAAALREAPVEVVVEEVKPQIQRTAGSYDRTTWGAQLLDEQALIRAVVDGKHGIPLDILQVNQAKLGEYARSLHERIDLWPGVRHTKKVTTV